MVYLDRRQAGRQLLKGAPTHVLACTLEACSGHTYDTQHSAPALPAVLLVGRRVADMVRSKRTPSGAFSVLALAKANK